MTKFTNNPCFYFTEEEFNNAKSRDILKCHCTICGKPIYMAKHYIQAKIKKNSNNYICSKECEKKRLTTSIKTNCLNCGKAITIKQCDYKRSKTKRFFCSNSCSAIFYNKSRKKSEEEKAITKENARLRKNERKRLKESFNRKCRVCGQNKCKHPEICKSGFFRFSNNLSKLGFDMSTLGSEKVYIEYERIKKYLYSLYHEKMMSYPDICKMHNIPKENTIMLLFKFFAIKPRTLSESVVNSFKQGKITVPEALTNKFKNGYHTSWDNKKFFYRSSYELDFMMELDNNKISYEVERLRIKYFNNSKNRYAIAIPDFYIPSTNTIVEVKSRFTYNRNEMIDKMTEYKKLGYNFILLYEHKQYDYCIEQEKNIL